MKIIVAITGASGAIYAVKLLEELRRLRITTHVIVSKWGRATIETETNHTFDDVLSMSSQWFDYDNMSAPPSSGSSEYDAMVVIPCSMKTLSGIRNDYEDNLIVRAASVILKERKRLVLVTRETPLSIIQIDNMLELSRAGAVIMPPVIAFYMRPESLEDVVAQFVARVLAQLDIESPSLLQWQGFVTE